MRCLAIIIYFLSISAVASPVIIQKPIIFNDERIELTREYRKQHYGIAKQSILITPQMIVLHWTAIDSFQKTFDEFNPPALTERPDIADGGNLNVSAQFVVDKDGTIYQMMPSNWMARHVIGLNDSAIGIENVGEYELSDAQVDANVALIRMLVQEYPTIHYLIGHYEYLTFKNSPLWKEKNPTYFTDKIDPGESFMNRVRNKVVDLKLENTPEL